MPRPTFRTVIALVASALAIVLTPFAMSPAHADDPWAGEPSGQVLDSVTGLPVAGVHILITDETGDRAHPLTTATTDLSGHYRAGHLDRDEIGIYVDGSDVGHESGFVGCTGEVVATFGEACTTSPSGVAEISLDPLRFLVLPDWREWRWEPRFPPLPPLPRVLPVPRLPVPAPSL